MSAKKILMLVGDFVEDYEAMVPFQMLLMVGHQVHATARATVTAVGPTAFNVLLTPKTQAAVTTVAG